MVRLCVLNQNEIISMNDSFSTRVTQNGGTQLIYGLEFAAVQLSAIVHGPWRLLCTTLRQ